MATIADQNHFMRKQTHHMSKQTDQPWRKIQQIFFIWEPGVDTVLMSIYMLNFFLEKSPLGIVEKKKS